MSEEYLLQADHVLIVVDIKRAVSSESLKSALLEELQKETRDNPDSDTTHDLDVSVVCTHADVSRMGPKLLLSSDILNRLWTLKKPCTMF